MRSRERSRPRSGTRGPWSGTSGRGEDFLSGRDEVVDIAAVPEALDPGQRFTRRRRAEGATQVANSPWRCLVRRGGFRWVRRLVIPRSRFRLIVLPWLQFSVHSPFWLTGDRRLCCVAHDSCRERSSALRVRVPQWPGAAKQRPGVRCCVVASSPPAGQRFDDVMLLARYPEQLFGQKPITPYRFPTALRSPILGGLSAVRDSAATGWTCTPWVWLC